MTTAVCMNCGMLKSVALLPCPQCGFTPASEDEILRSLAMSDRYFRPDDLKIMGARIASGLPVELDALLFQNLKEALKILQTEHSWIAATAASLSRLLRSKSLRRAKPSRK